jgi:hypothetical protein
MKYVRFKKAGIVMVESQINHNEVKSPYCDDTAISAGFFRVEDNDMIGVHGESVTLKLRVAEDDLLRFKRIFRGY